jgi:SAM-dependent methyltransferase
MVRFYASGRSHADLAVAFAQRVRPDFRLEAARVLDFGCGPGRVLRHFVGEAAWSEGWDFSKPHLDRLVDNFQKLFDFPRERFGVRVLDSLAIAAPEPGFDLLISFLVLQHNPPPLMNHLLREALRSLCPRGIAVMHITTAPLSAGYEFSLGVQRPEAREEMQMHALPKGAIFKTAAAEDCSVEVSIYSDFCGPDFFNELFVFAKADR